MKILTKEDSKLVLGLQKHVFKQVYYKFLSFLWVIILVIASLYIFDMEYLAALIIWFTILFLIIYPIIFSISNKKVNQTNALMMQEKIVEYEFQDEEYSFKVYQSEKLINFTLCKYENIYKVDETGDAFYIFIGHNQAVGILKEDIDANDIDKLRGILQGHVAKYKITKW